MITCHRFFLEQRCRERGYRIDDVMPCVVSQQGNRWTIDINHPAYPRAMFRRVAIGDVIGNLLSKAGITKKRVSHWLGGKQCRCEIRQRQANEWGYKQQDKIERMSRRLIHLVRSLT